MASASQRRPPAQLHIKKLASSGRIDEGLSGRRGPRLGRRVEGAGRVPRLPPTGAVRLPARRLQGALSIAKARKQQGQARLSVEWLTQAARGEQSGRLEEPRVSEQGQQPSFATHAQRRAHQADVAIRALLRELPAYVPSNVLGKAAERQVPDPSAREALLLAHFRARAGPSGENARLGLRAWRALKQAAAARGLPRHGLPASAAFVADVARAELQRAMAKAKTAQRGKGGTTVGRTFRRGFVFLQDACRLAIDASGALVEEAVEPPAGSGDRPTTHAGSLPIAVQCAFEVVAAEAQWSVRRTIARAFLTTVFAHHIRFADALMARLWPDEVDPARVIRGAAKGKGARRALPIQLYAAAEGFLGDWLWLPEHLAELAGREHAIPAFDGGRAGRPSEATRLVPGVIPQAHMLKAFRDVLESSPFRFPEPPAVFYERWGLTGHSPHSTGSDMARFIGWRGGFVETDARELGHWLRDKKAPQPDPRQVPGAPQRGQPDGQPCARGGMSLRYSQGKGRRGEREVQLDVRERLVDAVRVGLEAWGRPWRELPPGNADWDILRAARGGALEAAAAAAAMVED